MPRSFIFSFLSFFLSLLPPRIFSIFEKLEFTKIDIFGAPGGPGASETEFFICSFRSPRDGLIWLDGSPVRARFSISHNVGMHKKHDFGNNLSFERHNRQNRHLCDLEGEKLVYKLFSLVPKGTLKVPNLRGGSCFFGRIFIFSSFKFLAPRKFYI